MSRGERGSGWIGWLIFLFILFGFRLLAPLANWLSQVTGLPITPPLLFIAIIALAVMVSFVNSLIRSAGRSGGGSDTRLPTSLPVPSSSTDSQTISSPSPPPVTLSGNPPPAQLTLGEEQLPRPPKFEPIIDPRIFAAGIAGFVILGALAFLFLVLAGALP